jgi:hypothetical protein
MKEDVWFAFILAVFGLVPMAVFPLVYERVDPFSTGGIVRVTSLVIGIISAGRFLALIRRS